MRHKLPPQQWQIAGELRDQETRAEAKLWHGLRNSKLGAAFRRQHPVGPFIVDFICLKQRLIVEIDGDSHAGFEAEISDRHRQSYLEGLGYRVIRYTNQNIFQSLEQVLLEIQLIVQGKQDPPASPHLATRNGGKS